MVDTTRHNDLITSFRDDLSERTVVIVGCGSIGSCLATLLARLGFKIFSLYDPDTIEEQNIANQYFYADDVGRSKVNALRTELCSISNDIAVNRQETRFTERTELNSTDIVCACTDNMESRKTIARRARQAHCLLLDARMGSHDGRVHLCDTTDENAWEKYKKTLYNDESASTEPCTMRTILYTVMITSAITARLLMEHLNDKDLTYKDEYLNSKSLEITNLNTIRSPSTTHV